MRRYRRNDALQPPESAYSPEAWEQIAEFAASGAEALPVDIPMPEPDSHGRAPALVYRVAVADDQRTANVTGSWDPSARAEDNPYFIAYVYPREALDSRQHWYELRNLPDSSVWLVGFQHLRTPQQRKLWDSTVGHRRPRTGGLPVAESYLVRGSSEEARRAVVTLRRATMAWMEGEGEAVLESGAYDVEGTETYVAVSGHGDDLAAYDGEVRVLRDQVFGLYWAARSLRETDILEVYGPYSRLDHAQESAKEQRIAHDDRTAKERRLGLNADQVVETRRAPDQEPLEDVRDLSGSLVAIVYQIRTEQLLPVFVSGVSDVYITDGATDLGDGYLDSHTIGECARTHTPDGVVQRGAGYGLALYTALGTVAYMGHGAPCIASCPTSERFGSRSKAASNWWASQVRRDLAQPLEGGCAAIELQSLLDLGLVFWMAYPGDYEGQLAEAREKFLEAFAAAEPPVKSREAMDIIDAELSQLLSDEAIAEWRETWVLDAEAGRAEALTANRRRARVRPSFVTAAVRRRIEQLYAPLSGDDL